MSFLNLIFLVGCYVCLVLGQAAQPFTVVGYLDSATSKSGTAANRGGTVSISGFTVTIPDNLLVDFPAAQIPFAKFADGGAAARAGPNEVTITGNVVNNVIIAGQLSVSGLDMAFSAGFISRLDPDGTIQIRNGPSLRISDPNAKYTAGYAALPFFTADDENPSISSFSGFPMCVPRSSTDEKCPSSNRLASTRAGVDVFTVPDATHMVPMKVGDYVEYSGVTSGGQIVVYEMVVNVGILTSGSQPGFIRVEDAIIGVSPDVNNPDLEGARYKFVGYTSRNDLPLTVWAIDVDPCTGEESERLIATTKVEVSDRNKWEVRLAVGADIGLYTRNYRFKNGDNIVVTSDGIKAGQYVTPITEWIFPEVITPGATPPALDFTNLGALKNGFGPVDGTVFGQLNPWPGATAPAPTPSTCVVATTTATTPTSTPTSTPIIIANAGADQTVLSGIFVTFSGSQSTPNIPASDLSYNWAQIAGPTVTLSSTSTPNIALSPPVVSPGTSATREFLLTITHIPTGAKGNDSVVLVTNRAATSRDHAVIDILTWASKQKGTVTVSAHTDLVAPEGSMKVQFGTGAEIVMGRASTVGGVATYFYGARDTPSFTSATVRSYINGVLVPGSAVTSTNVGAG